MRVGRRNVDAISDGTFVARPPYFGQHLPADARPDVFSTEGAAWWPIGCFLIRGVPGRTILVDAGLGPEVQEMDGGMLLCGGQLPTGLFAAGCDVDAITDVICTHLHVDHVGWLFDLDGQPRFRNATYYFGPADIGIADAGVIDMADHIRIGFSGDRSRLHPVTNDEQLCAGVVIRRAAGHTPGGLIVDVTDGGHRLLLLGDAVTSPLQADSSDWHSTGDLDLEAATGVRRWIWDTLSEPDTLGVGAHFELLRPGSIDRSTSPTWRPLTL